jgi:hypothetical protein
MYIIMAVLGIEFGALHLLGKHSTTFAMSPAFLCFIFQIGSCIFAQGLPQAMILLQTTGITDMYHMSGLFIEMRSC